jgi:hypothetical protein
MFEQESNACCWVWFWYITQKQLSAAAAVGTAWLSAVLSLTQTQFEPAELQSTFVVIDGVEGVVVTDVPLQV